LPAQPIGFAAIEQIRCHQAQQQREIAELPVVTGNDDRNRVEKEEQRDTVAASAFE